MQASEKFKGYSNSLCEQIRWKKAHAVIAEEIENHLADQRDAYIAAGETEEEATEHAILQMGDPVTVGTQLDRTHRPKPQWRMLLLTAALLLIGLFIRFNIIGSSWNWDPLVQLLAIVSGLLLMVAAYFTDFTLIGKYPKTFFFLTLALSFFIIFASPILRGVRSYGVFITLIFPLGLSSLIYACRNRRYVGLVTCCMAFLLLCFMAILVPTVAGLIQFAICGFTLLLIAVFKKWFGVNKLSGCLVVLIPFTAILTIFLLSGAISTRLIAILDPSADPNGGGYISLMIRDALTKSKFIGHGAVLSPEFALSSPSSETVRLVTHIIYNEGWISFIFVISALLSFIAYGFRLCVKQKSALGQLVSIAVMLTFTAQVVGYILNNLGFPLTDPISLPLISYGNMAMILNLFLIGVMMSVFRTGDIARDKKAIVVVREKRITWNDGKLIISFRRKCL